MNITRLIIITLLVWLIGLASKGQSPSASQTPSPEEAIEKVFKVLDKQESRLPDTSKIANLLQKGAWEALAYVNAAVKDSLTKADLQEAVPDYYRFYNNQLLLKLINQEDYNAYGTEATVPYTLHKNKLKIVDPGTGKTKDHWEIMYLDSYYLALDYGDLRVFFVQTAPQE
jgi:hypothetical protein